MCFYHSTSDGLSTASFFKQLLEYCGAILDGESPEADSLPLLPAFEDVYYQRVSWPLFLWRMTSGVVAKDYRYLRYLGKYEKFVPVKQRKSKNIFFELEPEKTKRLAELARDEGITITGLLISALVISTS